MASYGGRTHTLIWSGIRIPFCTLGGAFATDATLDRLGIGILGEHLDST